METDVRQPSSPPAPAASGGGSYIATTNGENNQEPGSTHQPVSTASRATSRLGQWSPSMEELAPRRKKQQVDNDRRGRKASMNVFRLSSAPTTRIRHDSRASNVPFSPARSTRSWSSFAYVANEHTGRVPLFQSRDLFHRDSSGALESESVELDLLRMFTRIWHLRTYIRLRRLQGRGEWRDAVIINDSYGIEQTLSAWVCHYKPDSLEYAASMLFKEAFWIYFHRTIQPSRPDPAFRRAVDEGLHSWNELIDDYEEMDKDVLLTSLVLLGCAAFDPTQRSSVVAALERVVVQRTSIPDPLTGMLAQLWRRMDKGYEAQTWDWEACFTYSGLDHIDGVGPFLSELLRPSTNDPWSRSESRTSFVSAESRQTLASPARSSWDPITTTSISTTLRLPPLLSPTSRGPDSTQQLRVFEPRPAINGGDTSDRQESSSVTSQIFSRSRTTSIASPTESHQNFDMVPPTIPGSSSILPQPFNRGTHQPGSEASLNTSRFRPIDGRSWGSMVVMDQRPPAANPPEPPSLQVDTRMRSNSSSTNFPNIDTQIENSQKFPTRTGELVHDAPFAIQPRQQVTSTHVPVQTSPTTLDMSQVKSGRPRTRTTQPPCSICGKPLKNPSDAHKHQLQHNKPYKCSEDGCSRSEGFATPNDLQRHQISVHRSKPVLGMQNGYICVACGRPPTGIPAKYWPRRDNFRAHIKRKHPEWDEGILITRSEAQRPDASADDSHESPQNSQVDRSDGSA